VTEQLEVKAITVKTGTLIDATVIASASEQDGNGRWVKQSGRKAVHGFKTQVGADAGTALVEKISVTPANVNDGRADPEAMPDSQGEVFADSAGTPRVVSTGVWPATNRKRDPGSRLETSRSTACGAGSRRSSTPGNAATACDECDVEVSPKLPHKPTFTPPPTALKRSLNILSGHPA